MAQDVRQWLDEIKRLQQQLTEASRDRDEASESAAQWRQLYNTEAEQRRNDVKLTQQTIANLEAQIQQLQTFSPIVAHKSTKSCLCKNRDSIFFRDSTYYHRKSRRKCDRNPPNTRSNWQKSRPTSTC